MRIVIDLKCAFLTKITGCLIIKLNKGTPTVIPGMGMC